jgi:hypothetical protein
MLNEPETITLNLGTIQSPNRFSIMCAEHLRAMIKATMSSATKYSLFLIIAYLVTGSELRFQCCFSWFYPAQLAYCVAILLVAGFNCRFGIAWTAAQIWQKGVNDETRQRFRSAWIMNLITGLIIGSGLWLAYELDISNLGPAYQNIIPLVSITTGLLASVRSPMEVMQRFTALDHSLLTCCWK